METLTIDLEAQIRDLWLNIPEKSQSVLATRALNALLTGALYPTGTEQLELAIELAEAGVDAVTISKLSRLEKEVFEDFLTK